MKKIRVCISLAMCLAVAVILSGCGVSHTSPEGVVKSLVTAYEKGMINTALNCFDVGKDDKDTKAQAKAKAEYYKAMKSERITLVDCATIKDFKEYTYVYIYYTVELENNKSYPKMETYLTKVKNGKHYVIPTKDITAEMSQATEESYRGFMSTDTYKKYEEAYNIFLMKNPQFEENLTKELK